MNITEGADFIACSILVRGERFGVRIEFPQGFDPERRLSETSFMKEYWKKFEERLNALSEEELKTLIEKSIRGEAVWPVPASKT